MGSDHVILGLFYAAEAPKIVKQAEQVEPVRILQRPLAAKTQLTAAEEMAQHGKLHQGARIGTSYLSLTISTGYIFIDLLV